MVGGINAKMKMSTTNRREKKIHEFRNRVKRWKLLEGGNVGRLDSILQKAIEPMEVGGGSFVFFFTHFFNVMSGRCGHKHTWHVRGNAI